jgi:rhodanese-related sulfurtransferase
MELHVSTKQIFSPKIVDNVPEISPDEFREHMGKVTLIDVRRPDEFDGELSHIPGAKLVTLGPELDAFLNSHNKEDEVVFVCRSGARSGHATLQSRSMGFLKCVNLQGGMILWNQRKFPTTGGQ